MLELVGLIFGGVSRLAQHAMDLKDKQLERDHEHRMLAVQIEIADKRFAHDAELRKMDAESAKDTADANLLIAALQAQADEAKAAGGWVAKLSASVRPVVMYWLMAIYTVTKVSTAILMLREGMDVASALRLSYTEFDGTIMSSALSFFFADRSLRKAR